MLIGDNDKENLEVALKEIDRLEKENLELKNLVNLYFEDLIKYQNRYASDCITFNPALNIITRSLPVSNMFGISNLFKKD